MDYIIHNGELYHYGVLGMKWGKRRARKAADKAERSRASSKEWKQKSKDAKQQGNLKKAAKYEQNARDDMDAAAKYDAKSKQITAKHVKLAGGKKVYDYTTNQSTGKLVAKSLLMGTYGTLKYDQARLKGVSKGKAAVRGILYESASYATGGLMEIIEPRVSSK